MSGFAARFALDRTPTDPTGLAPIAAALGGRAAAVHAVDRPPLRFHYAIAGNRATAAASTAMSGAHWLAWDGRVDNRREIARALGREADSDAELALAGFEAWGEAVFDRIAGPFAALLVELERTIVRMARDPLGGRRLFFRCDGPMVCVATRPAALLRAPGADLCLDEGSLVRFLAVDGPRTGRSFYRGIEEVAPGALVEIAARGRANRVAAALRPAPPPGHGSDRDYEGRFRELLDQAVACRLPTDDGPAVLMSGGLDSTSIAATAARLAGAEETLAVSWIFDELADCDERPWIEQVVRHTGVTPLWLVGDEDWPLAAEASWPRDLDAPFLSLYWRLHVRAFQALRARQRRVLLTGQFADDLWLGGEDWLASLLATGRPIAAAGHLARAASMRLRRIPLRHGPRAAVARLLRGSEDSGSPPPPWLTEQARTVLARDPADHAPPTRQRALVSPSHLAMLAVVTQEALNDGIEIRHPYRDRRLVESILGAPAHLLYLPGETKRLLRRSLHDRLPPPVLARRPTTSLLALARRGLRERAAPLIRQVLEEPDTIWSRYVHSDWLWTHGMQALDRPRPGMDGLVLWHCYALERWRRALASDLATAPEIG